MFLKLILYFLLATNGLPSLYHFGLSSGVPVTAGDPATLEYTVTGTPELKPKWYKDGRPLVASKKYRISFKNNVAQLKFYSAELHDSGQYTFEISNEVGSSSCETTFTVLG